MIVFSCGANNCKCSDKINRLGDDGEMIETTEHYYGIMRDNHCECPAKWRRLLNMNIEAEKIAIYTSAFYICEIDNVEGLTWTEIETCEKDFAGDTDKWITYPNKDEVEKLDTNGDGILDYKEWISDMLDISIEDKKIAMYTSAFYLCDTDNVEGLSWTEVENCEEEHVNYKGDWIDFPTKKEYDLFDTNADGNIDYREWLTDLLYSDQQ